MNHLNNPEMISLLASFEKRWEVRCKDFRYRFLTEKPEMTISIDYLRPVTKSDFEKMISLIRGVKSCRLTDIIGGIDVRIKIHSDFYWNRILVKTIEYDCNRIIKKFMPIGMVFHITFEREDVIGYIKFHSVYDGFAEAMKRLRETLYPFEMELSK